MGLQLAENGIDRPCDGLDPFLPPTPTVNVLRHVDIGMPHIVARDFRTSAGSQHQTAMHCPETPEVDSFWQTQLHRGGFDLPVEQIMPVDGLACTVGKNQIFRPQELSSVAAPLENLGDDAPLIEWNLAVTSISLDLIELAVINALDDNQPVVFYPIPTKSKNLPNAQRI